MTATNNQLDRLNELLSEIANNLTEQRFFIDAHPGENTLRKIYTDPVDGMTLYTEEEQEVFNSYYDQWANALTELVGKWRTRMMEKYLLTIEFRYSDAPKYEGDSTAKSKTITIGVYHDFDDACKDGNKLMENLESKFQLHKFPDGRMAAKERFSKNGGCFGGKKSLITQLAYLRTPFEFYAKIDTLKYDNIDNVINDVVTATKRHREYKASLDD